MVATHPPKKLSEWIIGMTRQNLNEVLADLHVQLESVHDLAPDQAAQLRAAAEEIRQALDRSGEADEPVGLLSKQWDDATKSFSESHPMLASTIGRIADLLSQIGI